MKVVVFFTCTMLTQCNCIIFVNKNIFEIIYFISLFRGCRLHGVVVYFLTISYVKIPQFKIGRRHKSSLGVSQDWINGKVVSGSISKLKI